MKIETSQSNEVLIVRAAGRLDSAGASEFVRQLTMRCDGTARRLILDFSELTELGSAGLRVLFLLSKKAQGARDRLLVAGMQPAVREVFDNTGFAALYKVIESIQECPWIN
ncbi:STAS domain-containing protein [Herbaspirillum sp. RV1423]|uniref:STAS domain-containing protein n=1 Tax=Herbaspirillum sp. RV1423 TaxID=1443993 RepID=UPI0004B6DD95|nr:STAS domain-containing protein [Herbaspirillum sp. RV1423]